MSVAAKLVTSLEAAPIGVGFLSKTCDPLPDFPGGYDPQLIDPYLHGELCTFEICVISAFASDAEELLEDAVSLLDESCYFLVLIKGGIDTKTMEHLIERGADDVITDRSSDELAVALKQATQALNKRRRIQHQYQAAEVERAALQMALDSLPSPVFFKNRQGVYTGCNKAFERFIGLPQSKICGSSVYDIAKPEQAQVYYDADEKLMQAGGMQIYDAEVCYASGEMRDVTFHKAVTRDRVTGEVNGLAGAMLDVTERKQLEARLKRAAERDALTGAYNRRKFFELSGEAEARVRSSGAPLSVFVIDVDHFKRINDRFGHACGDAVLCHLVALMEDALPPSHVLARAGGEEFFCLLEECDLIGAYRAAEHVRETLAASNLDFDGVSLSVEVSIGVTSVGAGEALGQAIIRADQALYRAKSFGRNRVVAA
jgi:diguanylate cyclase